MASGPIISRQIDGETMETVTDFTFGAPKTLQMVTAAMKLRRLFLGGKAMTNLDSILRSRDVILPTKVKAMVFPVVMYEWRRQWQPHCSVLAWRTPGMGEPGGLPSMRSHRVRHD